MTGHFNTKQFTTRYLAWDEENRLMGVADNNQVSFYLYDAAGERTVKFTGHNQWVDVNGMPQGYAGADKLTLYASPYLVATSGQYTKHYYAGEQRIVSKIGGGGLGNYNAEIIAPETHRKKVTTLENMVRFIGNTLYLKTLSVKPKPSVPCNQEGMLVDLCNYRNIVHPEEDRYFYHPDHLGSSSWITDRDGMPMQHLAYLPFGEEFVDQKTSNWSAAYKFSGKEKDEETGYNYFHARYYSSDLGIFIGIDPESDRYPSLCGYSYCANNPIRFIDPDGRTIGEIDEEAKKHINRVTDKSSSEYNRAFARRYRQLEKSEKVYNFKMGTADNLEANGFGKVTPHEPGKESYDIIFTVGKSNREKDPRGGFGELSVLFEETYHASRLDKGINIGTCMEEARAWKFAAKAPGSSEKFDAVYRNPDGTKTTGKGYTVNHNVKTSTLRSLAGWLKNGMSPGLNEYGQPYAGFPALYKNLPLK